MRPETREQYIKNMKLSVMAIEAIVADLKKSANTESANIRHFKEIKDICERQIDLKRMEGRKNY